MGRYETLTNSRISYFYAVSKVAGWWKIWREENLANIIQNGGKKQVHLRAAGDLRSQTMTMRRW